MDRETEAAAPQAPAANGLPPIFQRPTYPSGEPATRAPERAPEEPRSGAASRDSAETGRGESTGRDRAPRSARPRQPAGPSDGPADDGRIRRTARRAGMAASPRARRRPADAVAAGAAEEAAAEVAVRIGFVRTTASPGRRPRSEPTRGRRTEPDDENDGLDAEQRRRQGGRGRGSRSSAARRSPRRPPPSQRDDAQPDARPTPRARGRRHREPRARRAGRSGAAGVAAARSPRRYRRHGDAGAAGALARPQDPRGAGGLRADRPAASVRARSEAGRPAPAGTTDRRRPGSPTSSWSSPSTEIGTRSPCSKRTCSCSTTSRVRGAAFDGRQRLPRPDPERAAGDGGRVRRHRPRAQRCALRRRGQLLARRPGRRAAAADRAGAEVRPGRHGAGHEGSDGGQGRAAHGADLAAGSLPRPRARPGRLGDLAGGCRTTPASG